MQPFHSFLLDRFQAMVFEVHHPLETTVRMRFVSYLTSIGNCCVRLSEFGCSVIITALAHMITASPRGSRNSQVVPGGDSRGDKGEQVEAKSQGDRGSAGRIQFHSRKGYQTNSGSGCTPSEEDSHWGGGCFQMGTPAYRCQLDYYQLGLVQQLHPFLEKGDSGQLPKLQSHPSSLTAIRPTWHLEMSTSEKYSSMYVDRDQQGTSRIPYS